MSHNTPVTVAELETGAAALGEVLTAPGGGGSPSYQAPAAGGALWTLTCSTCNLVHQGWQPRAGSDSYTTLPGSSYVDSINPQIEGIALDDAQDEAAFIPSLIIPIGATTVEFLTSSRPETDPAASKNAALRFAFRQVGSATEDPPAAWAASSVKLYVTFNGGNVDYRRVTTSADALASHGLAAGVEYQMQLWRDISDVNDNLVDDIQVRTLAIIVK